MQVSRENKSVIEILIIHFSQIQDKCTVNGWRQIIENEPTYFEEELNDLKAFNFYCLIIGNFILCKAHIIFGFDEFRPPIDV